MPRRRIRALIAIAGVVGGIKAAREILVARHRANAPEILSGHAGFAPVPTAVTAAAPSSAE